MCIRGSGICLSQWAEGLLGLCLIFGVKEHGFNVLSESGLFDWGHLLRLAACCAV